MRLIVTILMTALLIMLVASTPGFAQQENDTWYCISDYRDAADIVYLVNYLYRRGPAPEPVAFAGNIDCTGGIDLVDAVYLVNYVYRGGPSPCGFCGHYRDPTHMEDAGTIALFLGDEVFASEALVSRVQTDLERLRTQGNAEQTPLSSLHFATPWSEGQIGLLLDSTTFEAIEHGTYHAWDSLNAQYRLEHYVTSSFCHPVCIFHVFLYLDSAANCRVLAEIYQTLPGIIDAWTGTRPVLVGQDDPNDMFPRQQEATITYLFAAEWGGYWDIPSHRWYWYAAATPDTAWIVGNWLLLWEFPWDNPNAPEWWPEALGNIEGYRGW